MKDEVIEYDDKGKVYTISKDTPDIDMALVVNQLAQYIDIGKSLSEIKKTVNYIVRIPIEYQEAFSKGEVVLNRNSKNGNTWPQLVRVAPNGKKTIVANLKVCEQMGIENNPFPNIVQNMNNIYIQKQIAQVAETVKKIYKIVERIEMGQHSDRVALIKTGKNQIMTAMDLVGDKRSRELQLARNNLIVGRTQLLEEMQNLINGFSKIPSNYIMLWKKEIFHSGYFREKDEEFYRIQNCYALYLEATKLIAYSLILDGDVIAVDNFFEQSADEMGEIDFSNVESIENLHPNIPICFYHRQVEFINVEKELAIEMGEHYDYVEVKLSGKKLLEVYDEQKEEV